MHGRDERLKPAYLTNNQVDTLPIERRGIKQSPELLNVKYSSDSILLVTTYIDSRQLKILIFHRGANLMISC